MGFSRTLDLAGRAAVFTLGAAMVFCALNRLYACMAVLLLAALWSSVASSWHSRTTSAPRPQPQREFDTLQAEKRMLASLLDQTPAPLVILHADGSLKSANRAARLLFKTESDVVQSSPLLAALQAQPSKTRAAVTLDTDAGARTYAMSVADLSGPLGSVRLAALLDIQPELHTAEAAALREMMQVLSHELMNALTPVASLAATALDLLEDETPEGPKLAKEALATVARRAEGLSRFVQAYRALARLPPPRFQTVSLTALMEEAARLFHSRWDEGGVSLEVAAPTPDLLVQADEDLIVHALCNLLSNGAQAALDYQDRPAHVRLTGEVQHGSVRINVEDSGLGVAPELHDRIFQPFFTTKADGAGVGLSFSRQVALSHGGDLMLEPNSGSGGALFSMTLT